VAWETPFAYIGPGLGQRSGSPCGCGGVSVASSLLELAGTIRFVKRFVADVATRELNLLLFIFPFCPFTLLLFCLFSPYASLQ